MTARLNVTVDGVAVAVTEGASLLDAARAAGRHVPTLCDDPRLKPFGACRVCLVGVSGRTAPVASCTTPCADGMAIDTRDATARRVAGAIVELVLSELPAPPEPGSELATVAAELDVGVPRWTGSRHLRDHDTRHPYLAFRHELCISCGRCVRACDELQGAFALTATGRGFEANVTAGLDAGFLESTCVACGACADTCPTGAIVETALLSGGSASGVSRPSGASRPSGVSRPIRPRPTARTRQRPTPTTRNVIPMTDATRPTTTVTTTCGYCGVGCRLDAHVADDGISNITPAPDGPANRGHACVKGRFAHRFTRAGDRLTEPLIRDGDGFRRASWEEALTLVADEMNRIKDSHGPDSIAGLASSRATNEDCYAMQRLMRAAIGTNNIDNCSRVCHSPTSYALRTSLGMSGATGSFDDIEAADAAILIGVNPTEAHPVVGARIKQAALGGMAMVSIDPRRIELADYASVHLSPRPGTNAAVLLGLAHVIDRDGLADRGFIERRTEGFDVLADVLAAYPPEAVQKITGVDAALIEHAAHIYGEAADACLIWGLGVTEHLHGSEAVRLICNLALLTGKIGRPGSALLPLRGQNNVQGSSDMGALPDTYTAYRPVDDDSVARTFEQRWDVALSRRPGMRIPEMFAAAVAGELKAMYIFGEDVAQTDPNTSHVIKGLTSLEFLVCQEIFPNETTAFADVVLPASSYLEKHGTFTNAERRIQLVEPALDPPGSARTDLEIITAVSARLGHEMGYESAADVMDEIAALTPDFAGVSHDRLGRRGLQWPVTVDGADSPILFEQAFALPGGRARFAATPYKEPGDAADDEFPLILITGRRLWHYNAGTMTRRTANLELLGRDRLEIHPDDASATGVTDGAPVQVRSRVGRIVLDAHVTDRIEPGHVFTAFHFPEIRTNLLVGDSADEITACPEYKVTAVAVSPAESEGRGTDPGAGREVGAGAGRDVGPGAGRDLGAGAGREVGAGAGREVGADAGREVGPGAGETNASVAGRNRDGRSASASRHVGAAVAASRHANSKPRTSP